MSGVFATGSRRTGLALAAGLLGVACVLVVSACGSSSASTGTTPAAAGTTGATGAAGATGAGGANFTAYTSCLKSHGVTIGRGGGGPGGGGFGFFGRGRGGASGATGSTGATGASSTAGAGRFGGGRPQRTAAQQKAFTACASLRPAGGFGAGRGGAGGPGGFANNPQFQKFEQCLTKHGVAAGAGADRTSPAFQTALAACRSLLPSGGNLGGGGFGGFGGGATGAGGSAAGGAPSGTFAKFQACLKSHGVQPGATGQSSSKTAAAIAACQKQLPSSGSATTTTG